MAGMLTPEEDFERFAQDFEAMRPALEQIEHMQVMPPSEEARRRHFLQQLMLMHQRRQGMLPMGPDTARNPRRNRQFIGTPSPGVYSGYMQQFEGMDLVPPEKRYNPFLQRGSEQFDPDDMPVMNRNRRS